MAKRQIETYRITRREQIEALASPVRLEILAAARITGLCSIGSLARFLGRAPDSLYYHIRKLVSVGLLLEAGKRSTTRRHESLYLTAGRRFRMPFASGDTQLVEARLRTFTALLRLTDRDHRRAIRSGLAVFSGRARNIRNARVKGWLSTEELREIHEHISQVVEVFEREKTPPQRGKRKLFAVTMYLTPMAPSKRTSAKPKAG